MIYIMLLIFFAILYLTRTKNNKKQTLSNKKKLPKNRSSQYINKQDPSYDQEKILDSRMNAIKAQIQYDKHIDFRNMINEDTHIDSTLDKINDFFITKEVADGSRIKDVYDGMVSDGRSKVGLPFGDQPVYVYN